MLPDPPKPKFELLKGQLSVYSSNLGKKLTIFESGDLSASSVVLFIGGLTDGPGTVGYATGLSEVLDGRGWGLTQIVLSSSYRQYGISSLEEDVLEISEAVEYLRRERGKDKIVLLGHSTGCQDAMRYLTVDPETRPQISGAILQAPVSDFEYYEGDLSDDSRKWVTMAKAMVDAGQGDDWLPREASLNFGAVPFSAYRFASLYAPGGDDDFFSSNIASSDLKFRLSSKPILLLLGGEDQYYPMHLETIAAKEALLQKWVSSSEGRIVAASAVIAGANHGVWDAIARTTMYAIIVDFIESL